ncbi:MAG: hypothetical protein WC436_03205 [Candidatus Babeliales bacterium]
MNKFKFRVLFLFAFIFLILFSNFIVAMQNSSEIKELNESLEKRIEDLEEKNRSLRIMCSQADKQNIESVLLLIKLRQDLFNKMMPVVERAELDAEDFRVDAISWKERAENYEKILIAIFNSHPEIKEQIVADTCDSDD